MNIHRLLELLYEEIKHGDDSHQIWLKNKIDEFKSKVPGEVPGSIGWAFEAIKNGFRVTRSSWSGETFLYVSGVGVLKADGTPYWISAEDLVASDWLLVNY